MLVENGIDIGRWNVFSIVSGVVKQRREILMQKREEERRLEEMKKKFEATKSGSTVFHPRSRDFDGNLISRRATDIGIDGNVIDGDKNGNTHQDQ